MKVELSETDIKLLRRALVKLEVFYEDAAKNAEKMEDREETKELHAKIRACENLHFRLVDELETSKLR